jgi:hypothetical protein
VGRGSNSASKAPNSEPGWCFKFGAKNCGISVGHTFCLIDMKIASYLSNTESEKYQKNKSKKCKIWISTSAMAPWRAPLNFVLIVLCFSFFVICCAFLVEFSMSRGPNSTSKAPNSEPGWCFKFQAKNVEFI